MSTTQFRMKLAKFPNVKITLALFFIQEVGGWAYDSHAGNFSIEWYEPCPMVFLLIKDQPAVYCGSLPSRRLSSDDFKSLPNRRQCSLGCHQE